MTGTLILMAYPIYIIITEKQAELRAPCAAAYYVVRVRTAYYIRELIRAWLGLYPTSLSYLITVFNFREFQFFASLSASQRNETNSPRRMCMGRENGKERRQRAVGAGGGNGNANVNDKYPALCRIRLIRRAM